MVLEKSVTSLGLSSAYLPKTESATNSHIEWASNGDLPVLSGSLDTAAGFSRPSPGLDEVLRDSDPSDKSLGYSHAPLRGICLALVNKSRLITPARQPQLCIALR